MRIDDPVARGDTVTGPAPATRLTAYQWTVLGNTTLGVLMAMIDVSITLVALPDIFRGIHLDPLSPGSSFYLLWMVLGYLTVTSVLVVSLGRLGDMYGRVRMYNAGFVLYTLFSLLLTVTWMSGTAAATWLVVMRLFQAAGAAFLLANSAAIVTDAFPAERRGMALGVNQVSGVSGAFIGLVLGGLLGPVDWRLVFLVSVPVGVIGTVWAFIGLKERGRPVATRIDWAGNATFGAGLFLLILGLTYGIEPYGRSAMGWSSPWVLGELCAGTMLVVIFVMVERRVDVPMFAVRLFSIRAFAAATLANFCAALGRGGLMFLLVIWLQGVWLPLHGYAFSATPLWAAVHMIPLIAGMVTTGFFSGYLSDRYGPRPFAVGGALVSAACFGSLALLPTNFVYWQLASILYVMGCGLAAFIAPNRTATMNALPRRHRGAGGGMMATAQNSGQVAAVGVFFTLMIVGLSTGLPAAVRSALPLHGVPVATADRLSHESPVSMLFAAFLGYNPLHHLLGARVLSRLTRAQVTTLTGRSFFPRLVGAALHRGIRLAVAFAGGTSIVAAIASWVAGGRPESGIAKGILDRSLEMTSAAAPASSTA